MSGVKKCSGERQYRRRSDGEDASQGLVRKTENLK